LPRDRNQTPDTTNETDLPRAVERHIALARLTLTVEKAWPTAAALLVVAALFSALAWSGIVDSLPTALHWLLLAAFGLGALLVLLVGLWPWTLPSRADAIADLERSSGLDHRPLRSLLDRATSGIGSASLWRAHVSRLRGELAKLANRLPRADLTRYDPFALRFVALTLALVTAVLAGPSAYDRFARAMQPAPLDDAPPALEAWVTPPAYTGRPPIYLNREGAEAPDGPIAVPKGAVLSLRAGSLGSAPDLHVPSNRGVVAFQPKGGDSFALDREIEADGTYELGLRGRLIDSWTFSVTDDLPPTIALTQPPQRAVSGALDMRYLARDDYGVASGAADFALAPEANDIPLTRIAESDLPPIRAEVEPPHVALTAGGGRKTVEATQFVDLQSHPWAGLVVDLTLSATDDAGQTAYSEPERLELPARSFEKPLARAIIEQRQRLAFDPNSLPTVTRALDALTREPEAYIDNLNTYLALRAAYWRLKEARHSPDLDGIYELLWTTAVSLEDGDLSLAARALREAQENLMKALEDGASNAEIEKLMAELKKALDRYLEAMMAQAEFSPQNQLPGYFEDQNALERSDLDRMLAEIGKLAGSGARDKAREMLSQMQSILENLQAANPNPQLTPGEQAMTDALDEMMKMLRDQQELMDETFKEEQRQSAETMQGLQAPENYQGAPSQGLPGRGETGQTPAPGAEGEGRGAGALRADQEALQQQLDALRKKLGEAGVDVPGAMDDAGGAMGDAARSLADGQPGAATADQGAAIEALQRGAQALADQFLSGREGAQGQMGMGSGLSGRDPLGRPNGARGSSLSNDVTVPEEFDVERARRILEELRRRASEVERPPSELDYLNRLLERF